MRQPRDRIGIAQHLPADPRRVEPLQGCQAGRLAQPPPKRRVGDESLQLAQQLLRVAGMMCECVVLGLDQFRNPAAIADDDGPACGHGLGDDETEWLGRRARVHHDVKRAQRGAGSQTNPVNPTESAMPDGCFARSSSTEY
jgi:hypothetical protein